MILVGHDFGGACISYAMELFPSKVSKAIFIAATMLIDGQSALEIFSQQVFPCFLLHLLTHPRLQSFSSTPCFENINAKYEKSSCCIHIASLKDSRV